MFPLPLNLWLQWLPLPVSHIAPWKTCPSWQFTAVTLCALLTRDLLAIAELLVVCCRRLHSACMEWWRGSCRCLLRCRRSVESTGFSSLLHGVWHSVSFCVQNFKMLLVTDFLSASLYFSKRGAYWDRLCRDVVGRWLSRACTVAKRCILGL